MEAEVAAAARGLLTGGADEVVVLDNHASGNPVNVRPESLPAGARLETWNCSTSASGASTRCSRWGTTRARGSTPSSRTLTRRSWCSTWTASRSARATVAPGRRTSPCSGSAVTTFTLARSARWTASPTSSRNTHRRRWTPAPQRHSTRSSASPRTSRAAGGVPVQPPQRARLAAFVRGEPLYTLDIRRWQDARQPIADAMAAAVAPWLPYFTTFDLTSEDAMAAVHDEPLVREGRTRSRRGSREQAKTRHDCGRALDHRRSTDERSGE